jgi:energy-coupling factor transporter ATP-binding protein EcfA2
VLFIKQRKEAMKFTFEQFGYLDSGSVELADLTLICGKNNVGKTYISYAIYGFLKHFRRLVNLHLEKKQMERLREQGTLHIDLNDIIAGTHDSFASASQHFVKQLDQFFNAPDDFFVDSTIHFSFDTFQANLSIPFKQTVQFGKNEVLRLDKAEDDHTLSIVLQELGDESRIPNSILSDIISQHIAHYLFANGLPQPFVVTSERTGIALFYKELDISKNALVQQLSSKERVDPIALLDSFRSRYAEPIKDNIDVIRDYENLNKQKSFLSKDKKRYKAVFDALYTLLGGNFRSQAGQVLYRPKKERGRNEVFVPVYLASSSIKSLFLIDFYINCLAIKGGLLIIDEPELNLHPDNQQKMAGLLARLVNSGIKVLVTTHSDYLVREVNNRIMLSNHKMHNKTQIMKKNKLLEDDILQPQQVAAYTLNSDHTVRSVPVNQLGIDMDIFDELIANANRSSDEIYYNIKE